MEPNWIAEESVIFLYTDGRRVPGRIAVGMPVQISDDEAQCLVALDGIDSRHVPAMGSSPLQALLLGLGHLGYRLYDFISRGGRVIDPVNDSNFGIEAYFGPLLRHATGKPEDMEALGKMED